MPRVGFAKRWAEVVQARANMSLEEHTAYVERTHLTMR
jgi:hypothetical protein